MPVTTSTNPTLSLRRGDPGAVGDMLARPGVLLDGHFRLLSGLHSDRFLAFSGIAAESVHTELIAAWLAPAIEPRRPDIVLAPSTAGVALAAALAHRLGTSLALASLGCDGRPDALIATAGVEGRSVLLVNDVVTTGEGLERLAGLVRGHGGEVAGAAWFLSRTEVDVAARIEAPTESVGDIDLSTWDSRSCPFCSGGAVLQDALDLN